MKCGVLINMVYVIILSSWNHLLSYKKKSSDLSECFIVVTLCILKTIEIHCLDMLKVFIMHPFRGPKGRGGAPIGATQRVH